MGFLAPSLLLGLLAALGPWLIHRIGKRRARPVPFAAMQLLLRAERRVSARRRLREIALLVVRTALAAALPLVFARPYAERPSDAPLAALHTQSAVIVLDDSASMQRPARFGGGTLFDTARARARALVQQLPAGSQLALTVASAEAQPAIAQLTGDRQRVLEALDAIAPSARAADFTTTLQRAAVILASALHDERRIFVISDLQAAGWERGSGLPARGGPAIALIDVSDGRSLPNRAVIDVTAEAASDAGPTGIAVSAEVADWGARAREQVPLTVRVDGAAIAKGFVDLVPGGRARKRFLYALPPGANGVHVVSVELPADALTLDDRRFARIELARSTRVLIINGDPRTTRTEDEALFVESALRLGTSAASVVTLLPDDVAPEALDRYGVIFALNLPGPAPALAAALVRFVEQGGGLFLSVGARVDPATWNQRLGAVLPQPLALVRTAAAAPGQSTTGERLDERQAERLAPLDRRHPLLSAFPAEGEGLGGARFFKYVLLDPVPETAEREVVLRFESGAPALVERRVGRGRVLLLATTADREWTDLPIRPGFAPLVLEMARRLGGAPDREQTAGVLVGQPRLLAFAPGERRIEVEKPDRTLWVASQTGRDTGKVVAFPETDTPGFYRVRSASSDETVTERTAENFVVNVDVRESDPAPLAPDKRPDREAARAQRGEPPRQRFDLAHRVATALILLLLGESLLSLRRRHRSESATAPARAGA